ncbi:hypothetical protein BKI52_11985 [marine bacterium AO1-C]|nr:hypothetical protein BKI52_11985 [marine bacterium AO1-C]
MKNYQQFLQSVGGLGMVLLFSFTNVWAQRMKTTPEVVKQIDEQVWKPFIKAYATQNGALYNSVHTKDVLRVSPGGIRFGKEFHDQNLKRFASGKKRGFAPVFEFKFISRQAKGDIAYEVGLYKGTFKTDKGTRQWYGQFHVVLKKINGRWKIAQDQDMNNLGGQRVDEAYYQKTEGTILK